MLTYGFDLGERSTLWTSAEFSEVFQAVFGDGVTEFAAQYRLEIGGGLDVTVYPGYVYTGGRWLKSDSSVRFPLAAASTSGDRYDAIAARADLTERKVELVALTDVDGTTPIVNAAEYTILLYLIRVRRSATRLQQSDITDLRVLRPLLSGSSAGVHRAYSFANGYLRRNETRLITLCDGYISIADGSISAIKRRADEIRGTIVGDLRESVSRPTPTGNWLPCDGSAVSDYTYPELYTLIGSTTPVLSTDYHALKYWIYAGDPVLPDEETGFEIDENGHLIVTYTGEMYPYFFISNGHLYVSEAEDGEYYIDASNGRLYHKEV